MVVTRVSKKIWQQREREGLRDRQRKGEKATEKWKEKKIYLSREREREREREKSILTCLAKWRLEADLTTKSAGSILGVALPQPSTMCAACFLAPGPIFAFGTRWGISRGRTV